MVGKVNVRDRVGSPLIEVAISNLIRELREARSMTRPQLARNAKVGRVHLWAIETGRNIPGIATLENISEALGVGLNRLLTKSDAELLLEDNLVKSVRPLLPHLNAEHRQLILKTLQAAPKKKCPRFPR
jgi:transcriptional regulator with XRE-family HTH domain